MSDGTVTDVITIRRVTYPHGFEKITVDWDGDSGPAVHLGIIDAARRFEDLVATDTAPDWDGATATYEAVRAEHPDIDPDLVATIPTAHAASRRMAEPSHMVS